MALIRQDTTARVAELGIAEMPAKQFEFTDGISAKTHRLERPSAMAGLIALEQGLYALDIGETVGPRDQLAGFGMPIVQVSAVSVGRDRSAEIIGMSGPGDTWLGREGGTVIVKSPPGGGHVLVTSYGPAGASRRRSAKSKCGGWIGLGPTSWISPSAAATDAPEEIRDRNCFAYGAAWRSALSRGKVGSAIAAKSCASKPSASARSTH